MFIIENRIRVGNIEEISLIVLAPFGEIAPALRLIVKTVLDGTIRPGGKLGPLGLTQRLSCVLKVPRSLTVFDTEERWRDSNPCP